VDELDRTGYVVRLYSGENNETTGRGRTAEVSSGSKPEIEWHGSVHHFRFIKSALRTRFLSRYNLMVLLPVGPEANRRSVSANTQQPLFGAPRSAAKERASTMKPRNAFIAGCFIIAGVGILLATISSSLIIRQFPSSDLVEPFHQRATHYKQQGTNFVVFSSFALYLALQVTGLIVGIYLVGFSAFTTWKHLKRRRSAPEI
jgi:hypothetical protein